MEEVAWSLGCGGVCIGLVRGEWDSRETELPVG